MESVDKGIEVSKAPEKVEVSRRLLKELEKYAPESFVSPFEVIKDKGDGVSFEVESSCWKKDDSGKLVQYDLKLFSDRDERNELVEQIWAVTQQGKDAFEPTFVLRVQEMRQFSGFSFEVNEGGVKAEWSHAYPLPDEPSSNGVNKYTINGKIEDPREVGKRFKFINSLPLSEDLPIRGISFSTMLEDYQGPINASTRDHLVSTVHLEGGRLR